MTGITAGSLALVGYFAPLIFLGIVGFAILGLSMLKTSKKALSWITFASLGISAIMLYFLFPSNTSVYDGTIVFNHFGLYFAIVMIISAMFITYPSMYGLKAKSEIFYATLIFVTIGMIVAA